ncbi:MAG: hypothetical protein JKY94_06910 [Rhodobacteraceae bacterium]|nr:hypothetical protein [Paracoccaceae bacterium]
MSEGSATTNLTVTGKAGNDTITTGSGDDVIEGGAGNDVISSRSGNNVINGGAGDDTITGGDRNDELRGGPGKDTLDGGAGNNIFYLSESDGDIEDSFTGGGFHDTLIIDSSISSVFSFDLSDLSVVNMEEIHLTEGDQWLTLNPQSVIDTVTSDTSLRISGDAGDKVITTSPDWYLHTYMTTYKEGEFYVYFTNGDAKLNIDIDITLDGFPDAEYVFTETSLSYFTADSDASSFLNQKQSLNDLVIIGREGHDTIITGSGADTIHGNGGSDLIGAGAGNDQIWGGNGYDELYGQDGDDHIYGEDGWDKIYGGEGNDYLDGGAYFDQIYGENGDDIIKGDDGDDFLYGGLGADTIYGGNGNDTIDSNGPYASSPRDANVNTLYGGAGDDIIWATFMDIIDGGTGYDSVSISGVTDVNSTSNIPDLDLAVLNLSNIENIVLRTDQRMFLTPQDVIDATDSNDTLMISWGIRGSVTASSGDWVVGPTVTIDNIYETAYYSFTSGTVTLLIDMRIDRIGFPDEEPDFVLDSPYHYTAKDDSNSIIAKHNSGDSFTITGKGGNDVIFTSNGADTLDGGAGDDVINSGPGNDQLQGGDGNDELFGDYGDDILNGGAGNDVLDGGRGNDTLNGGEGDDILIYSDSGDSFDGGTGTDTLRLNWAQLDFSLSDLNVTNIEIIQLGYPFADNALTLTLQEVLDSTDADNQLIITGEAGDSVTSNGQNWVQGTDETIDGQEYHVYTSGAGTLLVDLDISQDIS